MEWTNKIGRNVETDLFNHGAYRTANLMAIVSSSTLDAFGKERMNVMGKILRLELQQIHPTQVTAGMLEIEEKRKHFASLSADELKHALKATPIPVVVGRNGTHFATDHHHLARALSDAQIEHAYAEIIADLSSIKGDAFWLEMATKGWVHPYDEFGLLHGVAAIPTHVSGLIDDPYRSLASFVRDAGGYTKTPEPFADFQWAAFFRTRIRLWTTTFEFNAAVQQAVHLAKSPDALVLPGFNARSKVTRSKP
ncbi:ParB-like protein [Burkholderia sp. Leaf177]|uniref:ParB-like protein n=1 Tax=Burkholderia sp. Leaf177 TaxID=1736287 RepID=UPI00138F4DE1|nr:ParB-like protein [Burkholderia sp. Leaf177]